MRSLAYKPPIFGQLANHFGFVAWDLLLWEMYSIHSGRTSYSALQKILEQLGFNTGLFLVDFETLESLSPQFFVTFRSDKNEFVLIEHLDPTIKIIGCSEFINKSKFEKIWDRHILVIEGNKNIPVLNIEGSPIKDGHFVHFYLAGTQFKTSLGILTTNDFKSMEILAFEEILPTNWENLSIQIEFLKDEQIDCILNYPLNISGNEKSVFNCFMAKPKGATWIDRIALRGQYTGLFKCIN